MCYCVESRNVSPREYLQNTVMSRPPFVAVRFVSFENPQTRTKVLAAVKPFFRLTDQLDYLHTPINYSYYTICILIAINRCMHIGVSTMRFDGARRTRFWREKTWKVTVNVTFKTVLEKRLNISKDFFFLQTFVLYIFYYRRKV